MTTTEKEVEFLFINENVFDYWLLPPYLQRLEESGALFGSQFCQVLSKLSLNAVSVMRRMLNALNAMKEGDQTRKN